MFFRTIVLNLKVTKVTSIQIFSRNWNLLTADIQLNFRLKSALIYSLIIIRSPSLVYVIWKVVLTKILRYWKVTTIWLMIIWMKELLNLLTIMIPLKLPNLPHGAVVREEKTLQKLELCTKPQPKHQDNCLWMSHYIVVLVSNSWWVGRCWEVLGEVWANSNE